MAARPVKERCSSLRPKCLIVLRGRDGAKVARHQVEAKRGWSMRFFKGLRLPAVLFGVTLVSVAETPAWAASESVLYSFKGPPGDGASPNGLVYNSGAIYGTSSVGGSGVCPFQSSNGCGTVFSLALGGSESVLYNFAQTDREDGADPNPGLITAGGALYGTTNFGGHAACTDIQGSYGCGTVFQITAPGIANILHSFQGSGNPSRAGGFSSNQRTDGSFPNGGLVKLGGELYGTTQQGGDGKHCDTGAPNCGIIFKVSLKAAEKVIYTFGHRLDGDMPSTGLVKCNGALYGATTFGGPGGYGTIYRTAPSGLHSIIFSFDGDSNGSFPAELTCGGDRLYGSTFDDAGNSTVFKIDRRGRFKALHTFEGSGGTLGLNWYHGALYGVTVSGGNGLNGTIFKITEDGVFSELYAFRGISSGDGEGPLGMINVGGTFYGVTSAGGSANQGTVFQFTP